MKHSPFAFFAGISEWAWSFLTVMPCFAFVFMDSIGKIAGGVGVLGRPGRRQSEGGKPDEIGLSNLKMKRAAVKRVHFEGHRGDRVC